MNLTSAITKDYKYEPLSRPGKTNPILSAIAPVLRSFSGEGFAKADSNAGSKRNETIAASNLRAYGQRGVCRRLGGE